MLLPSTPSTRKNKACIGTRSGRASKASYAAISALPPPPLFQKQHNEGKKAPKLAPVVILVGDEDGTNRIPLSPRTAFIPVQKNEESYSEKYPASPFPVSVCSPVPSTVTLTTSATTAVPQTPELSITASSFVPFSPSPSTRYCFPVSPTSCSSGSTYQYFAANRYNAKMVTPASTHSKSGGFASPKSHRSPGKKRVSSNSSVVSNVSSEDVCRRQRIKTELCIHYVKGIQCPFGPKCTYAHGEGELQMTRLMDLQRAGLIENSETYRTKPCWTWVATGSCPFGKRCVGIHDPRISGAYPSWLPHTETQGNSISTDINVDGLHQKRLHTILYSNPFGDQFSVDIDDFADLYKLVCNTNVIRRRRNTLSEAHKLSIALEMRGDPGWMYKYRPQHVIHNTLCMVLQKRAFRLEKSGVAVPISISKYNGANQKHVLVRELAFGPDSDTSVRGVALYFNVAETNVSECTPQQAKRYRWKKTSNQGQDGRISIFDTRECFSMIRPHDKAAFDLVTGIMKHRYETLKAERLTVLNERFAVMKKLAKEKEALKDLFLIHRQNWINWCWPVSIGRQAVDEDTPVPPVDSQYTPILDSEAIARKYKSHNDIIKGSAIQSIWGSFLENQSSFSQHTPTTEEDRIIEKKRRGRSSRKRLPIFDQLRRGEHISDDRSLPHISFQVPVNRTNADRQSERCWKSLLLNPENKGKSGGNEWDIVQEHFQNSRSTKVLDIIQN